MTRDTPCAGVGVLFPSAAAPNEHSQEAFSDTSFRRLIQTSTPISHQIADRLGSSPISPPSTTSREVHAETGRARLNRLSMDRTSLEALTGEKTPNLSLQATNFHKTSLADLALSSVLNRFRALLKPLVERDGVTIETLGTIQGNLQKISDMFALAKNTSRNLYSALRSSFETEKLQLPEALYFLNNFASFELSDENEGGTNVLKHFLEIVHDAAIASLLRTNVESLSTETLDHLNTILSDKDKVDAIISATPSGLKPQLTQLLAELRLEVTTDLLIRRYLETGVSLERLATEELSSLINTVENVKQLAIENSRSNLRPNTSFHQRLRHIELERLQLRALLVYAERQISAYGSSLENDQKLDKAILIETLNRALQYKIPSAQHAGIHPIEKQHADFVTHMLQLIAKQLNTLAPLDLAAISAELTPKALSDLQYCSMPTRKESPTLLTLFEALRDERKNRLAKSPLAMETNRKRQSIQMSVWQRIFAFLTNRR